MRDDFDTTSPDAPNSDITSALQPDPSLVNGDVTGAGDFDSGAGALEDICEEIFGDDFGDDADDGE